MFSLANNFFSGVNLFSSVNVISELLLAGKMIDFSLFIILSFSPNSALFSISLVSLSFNSSLIDTSSSIIGSFSIFGLLPQKKLFGS